MTRYYLNKLFGGAKNAQRIDPSLANKDYLPSAINFALQTTTPTMFSQNTYSTLAPMIPQYLTYTLRGVGGYVGEVWFYVEQSLSNDEAQERLWRFLMRGGKAIELP